MSIRSSLFNGSLVKHAPAIVSLNAACSDVLDEVGDSLRCLRGGRERPAHEAKRNQGDGDVEASLPDRQLRYTKRRAHHAGSKKGDLHQTTPTQNLQQRGRHSHRWGRNVRRIVESFVMEAV